MHARVYVRDIYVYIKKLRIMSGLAVSISLSLFIEKMNQEMIGKLSNDKKYRYT